MALGRAALEVVAFRCREDAERYLRRCGYVFVGAPDRWRLVAANQQTYARIASRNGAWIVTIGRPRER